MVRKQTLTVGRLVLAVVLMSAACSPSALADGFYLQIYKGGVLGHLNFTPAFTTIDKFNVQTVLSVTTC